MSESRQNIYLSSAIISSALLFMLITGYYIVKIQKIATAERWPLMLGLISVMKRRV